MKAVCLVRSPQLQRKLRKGFLDAIVVSSVDALFSEVQSEPSCPCLIGVEVSAVTQSMDAFFAELKSKCNHNFIFLLDDKTNPDLLLHYIWNLYEEGMYRIRKETERSYDRFSPSTLLDTLSMGFVYNTIYGDTEKLNRDKDIFLAAGIDIMPKFVLTVIIDDFWTLCEDLHNKARYEIKRNLLNSTRAVLSKEKIKGLSSTLIGTDKVVILLDCGLLMEEEARKYAGECARKILEYTTEQTGNSVSIGVSDYCNQKNLLWLAYEQSFKVLQTAFHKEKNQVLHYEPQQIYMKSISDGEELLKRELIEGISNRDLSQCQHIVAKWIDYQTQCNFDENKIKSHAAVLLFEISQYCVQIGLDSTKVSNDVISIVSHAFKLNRVSDIKMLMDQHLANLIDMIGDLDSLDRTVNIAKAYIDRYYMEDLSLQQMASFCNYSPSYFSRNFKDRFGINFVKYLTEIRLEKAKLLLSNTDMPIGEISEKIGFHSVSHFSYSFKKENGQSPGEFRSSTQFK